MAWRLIIGSFWSSPCLHVSSLQTLCGPFSFETPSPMLGRISRIRLGGCDVHRRGLPVGVRPATCRQPWPGAFPTSQPARWSRGLEGRAREWGVLHLFLPSLTQLICYPVMRYAVFFPFTTHATRCHSPEGMVGRSAAGPSRGRIIICDSQGEDAWRTLVGRVASSSPSVVFFLGGCDASAPHGPGSMWGFAGCLQFPTQNDIDRGNLVPDPARIRTQYFAPSESCGRDNVPGPVHGWVLRVAP